MRDDLLLHLAHHLERGKLAHRQFDFSAINKGPRNAKGCGTSGCALGELPALWPDVWNWREGTVYMRIINLKYSDTSDQAALFFEISNDEARGLFFSWYHRSWNERKMLDDDSTRQQVARNIRDFVRWKRGQEVKNEMHC